MARILYGVSGDGIGHASRSKSTIEHMLSKGHQVRIISSRKGYDFLSRYFDVVRIPGFRIVNAGGEVSVWATVREGAVNFFRYSPPSLMRIFREVDRFQPDLMMSDFEPHVSMMSHIRRLPLVFVDNQHAMMLCRLEYPRAWRKEYLMARTLCEGFGHATHYYITSFFAPELKKRAKARATVVGPILREEVLSQKPYTGEHVLVYLRSPERVRGIIPLIENAGDKFVVYGLEETSASKNISFKRQSAEEFLQDLASSKAVITNGGHSLISEALYLGKPVYSIPTRKDFEQMINAFYVAKLGYGLYDMEPSVERLRVFLEDLRWFKQNIERERDNLIGNEAFFTALDSKISEVVLHRR